jgi:hypothetical protein
MELYDVQTKTVYVSHGKEFKTRKEAISYGASRALAQLIGVDSCGISIRSIMDEPEEVIAILQAYIAAMSEGAPTASSEPPAGYGYFGEKVCPHCHIAYCDCECNEY